MNEKLMVENYGSIKTMPFPPGWKQDESNLNSDKPRHVVAVHHPTFEKVQFGFYNRGQAISRYIAIEFSTVLQMTPHALTAYEIEIIEPILRTLADPSSFKIESIETILLNGRTVIKVEGLWLISGLRERGYFFAADDRGEYVQELHFFAPRTEYEDLLPQIMECVNSIKWQ